MCPATSWQVRCLRGKQIEGAQRKARQYEARQGCMFQQFQNRSAGICRFVYDYVWEIAMMTLGDMRQSTGWYFLLVAGWMLIMGLPTFAQNQPPPPLSKRDPIFEKLRPDEIIKQARERFKKHKTRNRSKASKCGVRIRSLNLLFPKPGDCCWRRRLFSTHIKPSKRVLASRGCKH